MDFDNLDPNTIAALDKMRKLGFDEQGRRVFVGLSYEESREYFALREVLTRGRRNFEGEVQEWRDAMKRREELAAKHEAARVQIIGAEGQPRH